MSAPFALAGYLVVQTFYVCPPHHPERWYYEIDLALDDDPKAPPLVFVTRDDDLYEAACLVEGTPLRVDIKWQSGRRADGKIAQLLTSIAPHLRAA